MLWRPHGGSAWPLLVVLSVAAMVVLLTGRRDARLEILTGSQAQLLREGVRVDHVRRGPLRVYLAASNGSGELPVSETRQVRRGGSVRVALTPTGRAAAGSCVALTLVVRATGAETARRALRPARRVCAAPSAAEHYTAAPSPRVDPAQLTDLPFGARSHWLQPVRAWSDTPPAASLTRAAGINFNVSPQAAPAAAEALAAVGVRRARIELGWNALRLDDPRRLVDPAGARRLLRALHDAGIRPLILLNANHTGPGPARAESLRLRSSAPAGARTVQLAEEDVARVRPNLTGFDAVDSDRRPDVLITAVDRSGTATLARPLPRPLTAGPHAATTLRYEPFERPLLENGASNPAFEATLGGWLPYARVIARFAHGVLGNWQFDLEVWNELSFGSDFLDASRYFDPPPAGQGETNPAILNRTVAWLRDPRSGVGPVGIADGFASQTPFAAGSTSPRGLTALSKHPYVSLMHFPDAASAHADQHTVDAAGHDDGGAFVPTYDAYFPEYWLTGIQTETLVRDLAPQTTQIGGVAHGRTTAPRGGRPPGMWLTEFNLVPPSADASRPGPDGDRARTDLAEARAKGVLRALVAYVHAGVSAIDFYAATGNDYGLAPGDYLARTRRRNPGGPLNALARLSNALVLAPARPRARGLEVESVADVAGRTQFAGDGTPGHPPLYDRDVLAVLPFALDDHEWVVPIYVMTRDVRRGLAAEPFRVTLAGLSGPTARASLYDPLTGTFEPVEISARHARDVSVDLPVTDAPRLLFLSEGAG